MRPLPICVLALLIGGTPSLASAACPDLDRLYPSAKISVLQMGELLDSVKHRAGMNCTAFGPRALRCSSNTSHEIWWLTEPGHPAYPAISRGVVRWNEPTHEICMMRDGYFAGDEEAFAAWFRELQGYDELTKKRFLEKQGAT